MASPGSGSRPYSCASANAAPRRRSHRAGGGPRRSDRTLRQRTPRQSRELVARQPRLRPGLLPRAAHPSDLRAPHPAHARSRRSVDAHTSAWRPREVRRAAVVRRRLARDRRVAVDDGCGLRRKLVADGCHHSFLEQRHTFLDPPQLDEDHPPVLHPEPDEVAVGESSPDLEDPVACSSASSRSPRLRAAFRRARSSRPGRAPRESSSRRCARLTQPEAIAGRAYGCTSSSCRGRPGVSDVRRRRAGWRTAPLLGGDREIMSPVHHAASPS